MTESSPSLPRRYRWLIRALLPLVRAAFWWRGRREPAWRRGWAQRMGHLPVSSARPLWLHAASVGEANSAQALLQHLWAGGAGDLHLTAFTPSGVARLAELAPGCPASLLPLDTAPAVARALDAIRPRALVVLETELWPELFTGCARRGIPVYLISARISDRSVRGYRRWFGRPALDAAVSSIVAVGAQTPADARRFVELGVEPARVTVSGSLKFDLPISAAQRESAQRLRERFRSAQVLLAASTHPGEEEALLDAWLEVGRDCPEACLVLAPRHPRRVPEILSACKARGLSVSLHSQGARQIADAVYVVDTLGELLQFYLALDVAFVGGSLVPVGGHNLVEPVVAQCAAMTGPYVASIAGLAEDLEAAGGLVRVDSAAAVIAQARRWWADEEARRRQCDRAAAVIAGGQGALQRNLAILADAGLV